MPEAGKTCSRIEDYALIGDCQTAALVARSGSIDWLCWPRFDGDAVFTALLGTTEHGRWLIAPQAADCRATRRYRDHSLVLETVFETADGAAAVIDFMPPDQANSSVIRIVEGRRGRVPMRLELVLRFDYGTAVPWVTRLEDGSGISAIAGPNRAALRTSVELRGENLTTVAEFVVGERQTIPFVLSYGPSHLPAPAPLDARSLLTATESHWQRWAERCSYCGPWQDAVMRSLLTMKALTYAPTGGIVAAPTTSLPERLGGGRNWDYRFCWLRDATLTLLAMMEAGYYDEAQAWRDWLHRAVAGSPDQIQIMYGLGGERRLTEWEMPWLPGYENSRPVRIGNAASSQLQLDVYGEVMDALYHAREGGLEVPRSTWEMQVVMLDHLAQIWWQPDEGLWEMRGGRRQFTFSKVMAWVALDRAVRSIECQGLQGPLDRWRALRDQIHDTVCRDGFDAEQNSFVQSFEDKELDASLLMMPLVGFLPADDPRMRGTVAAIERDLMVDGLVRRYRTEAGKDGLPPGEGTFLACSFWLADNLVLQNREEEARALFERLLGLCNDVGLLAEEYDPRTERQLGNFPQAFSHLALVGTAMNLHNRAPAERRGGAKAEA
ncbi:MAG: glycoside hydrolase family 15 protein [Alphaproteobacteria bacterium]|nr:glycoside hydrolase family 15 protein [Alphaproteobacteria bacterium]